MDYAHVQTVFEIVSYLLSYPDRQWRDQLDDCAMFSQQIPHRPIVQNIQKFIDYVKQTDETSWIETYVYTFDFGQKNKFIRHIYEHGRTKRTWNRIVTIEATVQIRGFDITERELPDYLPLMLEFASQAERVHVQSLMQKYFNHISHIREQLIAAESYYAILFDVLLMALEEIGVRKLAEGSVS